MITKEQLKSVIKYDLDTGTFTRARYKNKNSVGTVNKDGYLQIYVYARVYLAHRLAWLYAYGEWPKDQIDHINHDKLDNRIINLREATTQDNQKNKSLSERNKSGIHGVKWYADIKKWRVQIGVDKKQLYLGCFDDKFEAACARKSAERKYGYHDNHGEAK